jgi:hypothetical protein
MTQTAEIINEFVQLIDNDKDYDLKELKQMLSDVYKTKTTKTTKKTKKATKTEEQSTTDSEDDKPRKRGRPAKVNDKPKRKPSAYNNYVKSQIEKLKKEQPEVQAKDLMKIAAASWKTLSKEEQETYKVVYE